MKKLVLFFALTLGFVSAMFAQTGDVSTSTDYDGMIATFAGFAGCVVLLTEGIKALFPKMEGLATQIVSWCAGCRIRGGCRVVHSPALRIWRVPCGERYRGHRVGAMAYRPYNKKVGKQVINRHSYGTQ